MSVVLPSMNFTSALVQFSSRSKVCSSKGFGIHSSACAISFSTSGRGMAMSASSSQGMNPPWRTAPSIVPSESQ